MKQFHFDRTGTGGACTGGSRRAHPGGAAGKPAHTHTETRSVRQHQHQGCEDGVDHADLSGCHEDAPSDPELSLLSVDEPDSDVEPVDYGFIVAVTCLLTGISLVAVSYTVPRDLRADPEGVSAREMERLERERARVGAHLDRCVMAGLCLLTLGGALLSTLLMMSMYEGERMRRRACAYEHAARLYGSITFKADSSTSPAPVTNEDLEMLS